MGKGMEDLELAGSLLEEEKWNLVIVKNGQIIFSSKERGVAPFFRAVRSMEKSLHNAAAADRIVGSAIAMLCVHARVAAVYAGTASQAAIDILRRQGVTVSSKNVVPYISDSAGTGLCPFEKLAQNSENPAQLFSALKAILGGADNDDR